MDKDEVVSKVETEAKDLVTKIPSTKLKIYGTILLVVLVLLGLYYIYYRVEAKIKSLEQTPTATLPALTTPTQKLVFDAANKALEDYGKYTRVTNGESKEIVTQIIRREKADDGTDYHVSTFTSPEAKTAVEDIQKKSQEDKNDVLLSEQTTPNKISYYGIKLEKKHAIGVYTDVDKDGSAGAYYRNKETTVAVGKKYQGGGITARVQYDMIKW